MTSAPPSGGDDISAQPQYGGFWRRFRAYLIDSLILSLAAIPYLALTFVDPGGVAWTLALWANLIVDLAYFPFFWARGGRTPGMALIGLRVVRALDGDRLSGWRAVGRLLGFMLASIPLFLGLIWIALDSRKRGWHDFLAGTVVRREAPLPRGRARTLTNVTAGAGCLVLFGLPLVLVILIFLGPIVGEITLRDETGAITRPQDILSSALRVGDCFSTSESGAVGTVHAIPCEQPHVYEVFLVPQLPEGDFPSESQQQQQAVDTCVPAFDDYVGVTLEDSNYFADFIGQSEQDWNAGMRSIVCVLFNEAETPVKGSAEGSSR